ncbi:MAG: reverse gyrase [Candidatus Terraquivivens tikiterensis]|uniref:Reverse gyrase n=1 Tax=Candidatus Terraquivivens tikiterensis TaxID=1980982 RepID=A0A2R7Y8H5_9ARCH|nr:MAG: reverse gyrase [Candidatus Terraquivivens tikiterensis]
MIPVIYEDLCIACKKDVSLEEIFEARCSVKNVPFSSVVRSPEEVELEDLFRKTLGEPREIQRFWIKRFVRGESFTVVAPTGIGKTAFGLITSLFLASKGKKSYIIVPTTILVEQCVNELRSFCSKIGRNAGINEEGEVTIAFYHERIDKKEKEKFEGILKNGNFDVLVTTAAFLSKRFDRIKDMHFDFIFVDDVDAILKASKNVERVLYLLGFRNVDGEWAGEPKGILMVSTATTSKGKATRLFRKLLNFDVGSSFFTVRNVEDFYLNSEEPERIKEILRSMGSGCIIYARNSEVAEKYYEALRDEFSIGLVLAGRKDAYDLFCEGKVDHLIGTSYYYGLLVRGLDLPKKIRYVIFIGAPVLRIKSEALTPNLIKALALSLQDEEPIRRNLPLILSLERHPERLEEIRQLVSEVVRAKKAEDLVIREGEIIFPDIRTYIQGSGRSSRLTVNGLTKGASFLLEKDEEVLKAFIKRAKYYDIAFKHFSEADFGSLKKELDDSRMLKQHAVETIRPALFIVESPTKAKIISRFFGRPSVKILDNLVVYETVSQNYVLSVAACLGHVVDLVTDRGFHGVQVNDAFIPIYSTIRRCKRCNYQFTNKRDKCPMCGYDEIDDSAGRIDSIRNIAYQTGFVIIGTDPDAEGEKIAWDLKNILSGLAQVKRAEFHEVTPQAIVKALSNLRDVNEDLVKAQILRRVEDRWIGFVLSQLLWKHFGDYNMSAGRVQTPVLGWIIQRAKEFKKRRKVAYAPQLGLTFEELEGEPKQLRVEISLVEEREEKRTPLPPYTTDEMLKDANRILRLSSTVAMKLAQDLFESGFITYHRTDSVRVSDVGLRIAKEFLGEAFAGRHWSTTEGAHECIRPTRPWDRFTLQRMIYEGVVPAEKMTADHFALYDLVFRRFMSSQCRDVDVRVKKYLVRFLDKEKVVERVTEAKGRALEIYRFVTVEKELPEGVFEVDLEYRVLPSAYPYTQADVIKLMKERGIGRPSTYTTIIDKLFRRKYVIEKKHLLFPTTLGHKVFEFLDKNYGDFVSEERTRILLKMMDEVEKRAANYEDMLREVYEEIKRISWDATR